MKDFLDEYYKRQRQNEMRIMQLESRKERSLQRGDYYDCDLVERKLNKLRNEFNDY